MGAQLQACGRICFSEPAAGREISVATAAQAAGGNGAAASATPKELEDWASTARVKATPINDEGFICMGSKAPICPPQARKQATGPITLSTLQGSWIASGGAKVTVLGTEVSMNGVLLKAHRVELNDDGLVVSIGKLWQLKGWTVDGTIDFRCSSTQDNMDSARSDCWSRAEGASRPELDEKMKLLGYAGSAANPLKRGVEGCLPGTTGAEMGSSQKKDAEDVALLSALIAQWREIETCQVRSRVVVPDFTNRSQTGLGVELMHYVATSMKNKGFKKRSGKHGHDIPVLVREPVGSESRQEALQVWRKRVSEETGFPAVRVEDHDELFTSLGNGHFFQSLNLFDCEWPAINSEGRYTVGKDALLAEALRDGVISVILKHETPRPVRAKIAELLNSKRDFMWTLNEDGSVNTDSASENTDYCSQFEWLSKGMDAEQVNCLVRTHLGVKESSRIAG